MEHFDVLVIGGGAAGIAAARAAYEDGCSVALVDRKSALGGVLLQCTHPGFGNSLTGTEYVSGLLTSFPQEIRLILGSTVLSVGKDRIARLSGGRSVSFSQLILATGCREIPFGALPIAGSRPQGIYTAGQMQEMMNLFGFIPEGPVVILGSGDIGLVMAEQIASLDIPVTMVEQKESCGGMARNRRCLSQYPIRLLCSRTILEVSGRERITECLLSGGETISCSTLLIAAGLRPERSLVEELGTPGWLQLCGNCNSVHPMVEGVTAEGFSAGHTAAGHIRGEI